jgi:hypothetical protein
MFLLALGAIWISTWFPISFEPARVIPKQLRRFLWSCERLASPRTRDAKSLVGRTWLAFHLHEVTALPEKIGRWFSALPRAALGKGSPEDARNLAGDLQALGDRMRELVEMRKLPQSAAIRRELIEEVRAWRLAIQEILRRLAADPASVDKASLRARLDAKLETLETQIEKALNDAPQDDASAEEIDNMYCLLGAYRGVSEALIQLTGSAAAIDWDRLREAWF